MKTYKNIMIDYRLTGEFGFSKIHKLPRRQRLIQTNKTAYYYLVLEPDLGSEFSIGAYQYSNLDKWFKKNNIDNYYMNLNEYLRVLFYYEPIE